MRVKRPKGQPAWRRDWFCWFAQLLTTPEGAPVVLEPHDLLIIDQVFPADSRVRLFYAKGRHPGDRVENLVLIPKGNGKTTLMAALAIWHLLTVPAANCYIGAADKVQAGEMYRFASHYVLSEPELDALLKVNESTKLIRSRRDQGFVQVLASDDSKQGGKKQGFNPTLALIDELHAHENDNLYTDMRSGLFKRNGLLMTITTAGHDETGTLGVKRRGFLEVTAAGGTIRTGLKVTANGLVEHPDGRLTVCTTRTGNSVMLEWACRDTDDLDDAQTVKLANPASRVSVESIEDARESLTPWAFARYRANVWTPGFESWIPTGSWDELAEPGSSIPDGATCVAALDMARYRDCAALVVEWIRDGQPPLVQLAWLERSGGPDRPVEYEPVKEAIRTLHERFELLEVAYDPKYFDQSASELGDEGVPMVEFPQSNERMCPASARLREDLVRDKQLRHDGDPVLASHVRAGVTKDVGDNEWRLVKSKKAGPPIDALIALVMCHARAVAMADRPESTVETW